jgi:hypothetical protein
MVSVAQKLRPVEDQCQDQRCLILVGRLQEQRPQPQKTVLGLNPSEDGFCSLETNHDRRTAPGPKCLFQQGYYRNKGHNPKKSAVGLSSGEDMVFLYIENKLRQMIEDK